MEKEEQNRLMDSAFAGITSEEMLILQVGLKTKTEKIMTKDQLCRKMGISRHLFNRRLEKLVARLRKDARWVAAYAALA